MNKREDEIIMKEIEKIINTNKVKASDLRNCILNINKSPYTNDLHFQLIQFLGEFEYDLKTLFELFNDFKATMEFDFQNNINSFCSEINSLKKENQSLKNIIKKYENKKYGENNHKYKSYKSSTTMLKKNNNENTTLNNNINENKKRKTYSLNINLKTPSAKKRIKEALKIRNTNLNNNNYLTDNKEYILEYMRKNRIKKSEEDSNLNIDSYQRKRNLNSEMNFNLNKNSTSNNISRKNLFYDYDTYLTNLKQNSVHNSHINLIKYDNFIKENKSRKTDLKEIARGKAYDKNKKRKIIQEIFKDEKILNELKKQFGKNIENKLLNEDIDLQFFQKIEEIMKKIKKNIYYTPKIKNEKTFDAKENISYNFKIPKRFSNKKNDNSISNLIIAS